jgi:prepilin-type N-terminal cleavage/methylation domain-containing protein
MVRASISSASARTAVHGFTLIEVVVALGLLAVTVTGVIALHTAIARSATDASEQYRAAQLADVIDVELRRLRDLPVPEGQPGKLDALANLIPPSDSNSPLRLVASRDATRAMRESEADQPATGIALGDRFFLIEVRQQPAPLDYTRGAGYLAVSLTVKWPYQLATGPDSTGAMAADLAQASVLVFNSALTP